MNIIMNIIKKLFSLLALVAVLVVVAELVPRWNYTIVGSAIGIGAFWLSGSLLCSRKQISRYAGLFLLFVFGGLFLYYLYQYWEALSFMEIMVGMVRIFIFYLLLYLGYLFWLKAGISELLQ